MQRKTILREIGNPHLSLERLDADGVFLWTYENGDIYHTKVTYVYRLCHLDLSHWVFIGRKFLEYVREQNDDVRDTITLPLKLTSG
jgi:hypothetical protein